MYEFNLVLLLLQQMCVFLVIAPADEQNASVYSADAGHGTSAAQAVVLCHLLHFCILGTYFGLHIEDSIANTRAIGAVMGGLLGGPLVGDGGVNWRSASLLDGRHDGAQLHDLYLC